MITCYSSLYLTVGGSNSQTLCKQAWLRISLVLLDNHASHIATSANKHGGYLTNSLIQIMNLSLGHNPHTMSLPWKKKRKKSVQHETNTNGHISMHVWLCYLLSFILIITIISHFISAKEKCKPCYQDL